MSDILDARTAGRLRALSRVAFAVLILTLVLALTRATYAVRTAGDDLLRAEASMAAELWSIGGAPALDRFAPGRWTMTPGAVDDVDRPEVHEDEELGRVARAALYDRVG